MSAYRTPGAGATISCQRCASIVKRSETVYADDGSLCCRRCLHAAGPPAITDTETMTEWSLRSGLLIGLTWMLAGSLLGLCGFTMSSMRETQAFLPFAGTIVLGFGLFSHQLAAGRTRFAMGLAIGAGIGLLLPGLLLVLYVATHTLGHD